MSYKKEEEKKGGGALPTWMAGSARVGAGGSGAGVGGRAGLGLIARLNAVFSTKLASMAIIAGALAVSSYGLMDMNKRGGFGVEPQAKQKAGLFKPNYDSASALGLPGAERSGPSALELAVKANKGAFDESSASAPGKDQVAAQDAAASSDQGSAQDNSAAVPNAADVAAQAQQAAANAQSSAKMQSSNYGRLSSGNSRLSGGGGMSGGIGQGFQQAKLSNAALGQASAFSKGQKAKTTRAMIPANARGAARLSKMNSATGKRLDKMERAMASSRRVNPETGAAAQTQQWSNSQPGGQGMQGPGVSGTGIGTGSSGAGPGEGGPITDASQTPTGCPAGFKLVGSSCEATDSQLDHKNVTPWQSQVDMATALLTAASILLLLAFLIGLAAKAIPLYGSVLYAIAKYLAYAALALSAIVAVLGIAIMAQGQMLQGGIFTAIGALQAALAYVAAEGYSKAATAQQAAEKIGMEAGKQAAEKLTGEAAEKAFSEAATKGIEGAAEHAAANVAAGGLTSGAGAAAAGGSAAGAAGAAGGPAAGGGGD
ncbi:MAG: hypothetical protein HY922_13345 [Elusimicrobia bacterium]|nr:hypothetical protein [Elusimicrobiota bacterium]